MNLVIFGLAVVVSTKRFEEGRKAQKAKEALRATSIERATNFGEDKFRSIFKKLSKKAIPDSHCLVFWYASLDKARNALRSGIPATEAHGGGIVFTFNPPHKLDEKDAKVFPDASREVVLVCSIPRELLSRLPDDLVPTENGESFELSKENVQEMKEAFKTFDADGSGTS